MPTHQLFPTLIAHENLGPQSKKLLSILKKECLAFAQIDESGQAWCKQNHYYGYTSYHSIPQVHLHSPTFAELEKILRKKVSGYARKLGVKDALEIDTLWINVMDPQAIHTSHIHPLSVVSGTVYVEMPAQASPIRFEDPRFGLMMAQPLKTMPRGSSKKHSRHSSPYHFEVFPQSNELVLFESFLRHEVPVNKSKGQRITISFNYRLK